MQCDGIRPHPCSRCQKRDLTCVYQLHIKSHKDELIREIEGLSREKKELEDEYRDISEAHAGLQSENRDLQESSFSSNIILETISKNGHDKEIVARLRAGESHQSIADWLIKQLQIEKSIDILPQSRRGLLEVVKRYENEYKYADGLLANETSDQDNTKIIWTNVSSSRTLIRHLFDLYFTWIHPVHMLFHELEFLQSFRTNEGRNCSEVLVNAICAMGCLLLENEGSRKVSSPARSARQLPVGDAQEAATLREGFMNEARRRLTPDAYKDLTSVQALGIMYLVEFSSGKARNALGYLRSSVENLTAAAATQSTEAQQITHWGINNLNTYDKVSFVLPNIG